MHVVSSAIAAGCSVHFVFGPNGQRPGLPHPCRRNSAPPPPKPRGGRSALAGERSEPDQGSASMTTMHARFRDKVECKIDARPSGLFSPWVSEFESTDLASKTLTQHAVLPVAKATFCRKSLPQLHIFNVTAQPRIVSTALSAEIADRSAAFQMVPTPEEVR